VRRRGTGGSQNLTTRQISGYREAAPGAAHNVHPVRRCLVVQHVGAERAFAIEEALRDAGVAVDTRRMFAGDPLPSEMAGLDGLVVMGGPMSATSDEGFATRSLELALLAGAVASGLPTLGICLGAQLLAMAGGAGVYAGRSGPEVGWGEVVLSPECRSDLLFFDMPNVLTVLHWHGDTFDLPARAVHLAANERYANQAFRLGSAAWGLQFHLEVDGPAVEALLDAFGGEADAGPGGRAGLASATPEAVAALAPARQRILGRFARLVSGGPAR